MSQAYPYVITLSETIDSTVMAYAIQPVGENEDIVLDEENPIMAFGPMGKINIFVGATNAGKSRFLRTLVKCESYNYLPSQEVHGLIHTLINSVRYLMNSECALKFEVTFGEHQWRNPHGQTPHDRWLPQWALQALPGINYKTNFREVYNYQFFEEVNQNLLGFIAERISGSSATSSASTFEMGAKFQHAKMASALLQGELNVQAEEAVQPVHARHSKSLERICNLTNLEAFIFDFSQTDTTWQTQFIKFWETVDELSEAISIPTTTPPKRFYIPTLRSAVTLWDTDGQRLGDIFEATVRKNYRFGDKDENLQIFSGNELYNTLKRDRNGTVEVVARLRDFEKFLSTAFYEGRRVEIVALDEAFEAGQHINVRVQDETARELHDLGDGINTLIILLYQLFMAEPGSWVFIEEPELNLHPGLQRVFLQTLIENEALQKRELRVFFTTHSNHLLRMTLRDGTIATNDISVFAFQQRATDKDRFLIRPLITEHHHALALLGVQNASVLLAQCGIWVEGITDRQYVRAYLNAYQRSDEFAKKKLVVMREDTHFAFWEYAGSNLAHYLMSEIPSKGSAQAEEYERGQKSVLAGIESSALCNRIFLLADRDSGKSKKHSMLKAVSEGRNNMVYSVTSCIEIENLLSPTEINACLPSFFRQKDIPSVSFKQADYKGVRMGTFLYRKFRDYCPKGWVAKSGTLETDRKIRLCELAVKHISWDTMSTEAKILTRSLHAFIAKHNAI